MEKITVRQVSYSYRTKYQTVHAVKDVTCTFEAGKVYAIMGESGSGKSTFLSLLAGLDLPDGGDLMVDGTDIREKDRDDYRKSEASVVYQAFHLLPLLTVEENVMLPMEMNGVPKAERKKRATEFLKKVGLPKEAHRKFPKMMSGGEQQRVAIARSLAAGGRILLADEPTGNLDTENGQNVVNILLELAHKEGYLVVLVTHNPDVAAQADVAYRMKDGVLALTDGMRVP
ncbi:putative ABC transport system ATP-binding protein [Sporobacter termitidis DSM 10068]|uniref:Putative ABC transport system ATP-binding protein n=1 Tax=Sporobacter termitidis DSM 10068 TaxID=1123282 RepID=A0A1M5WBI6_9FIRM|nr:ABC transporter ATP-binding protein [Sporobacter termitidis]SHH84788.1 putative ABC transport system ATP-binding protein [Sporobacter termitidis DSM 10068]